MNVLSVFDGKSCGQIALQRASILYEIYYASEIETIPINVTQHHFPNTIQLGDVTKVKGKDLPKIDLLIGGSPCFTSKNLVMTSDGYKPIKEIKVGDMVLTHKNRYRKVLKIGGEKKETITIKSQGSTQIETTKNHPFYCFEDKKQNSQFLWKNIGDFKKGDKVVSINWRINKDLKKFSDIDLYILGRFLADGCCYKTKRKNRKDSYIYKFKISIGKHELEGFKMKVDDRFSYIEEKTVYNAFIYRKEWVELGEKFGHLAHNKFIPNFILDLPVKRLKIFLKGYMDGDGHIRKQASKINTYKRNTTVSEKLALTLSLAIQKCYNGVSICFTKRKNKHIIENRVVNQRDTYEVSYTENKTKFSKYKIIDDYIVYNLTKSTSFEKTGINNVYNLEVEEDNSYVVNNLIVHNCQGFSFSGKQLNFNDPRSKLFFEFVRLLKECKPKYFLLENVKMKKEYIKVISEHLGVEPILINSNLVSAQNRPRLYWTNIPNITQPEDKKIFLKDILETGLFETDKSYYLNEEAYKKEGLEKYYKGEKRQVIFTEQRTEEAKAIRRESLKAGRDFSPRRGKELVPRKDGKCNCLTTSLSKEHILIDEIGEFRKLTPLECERLQNIPDNFTNLPGISKGQRIKMLGNGWTIDVVSHIFQGLKQ